MDSTLHALGRILLNAIPTFFVVLFLILYLRAIFFKPLGAILSQRYADTIGAQKEAQDSIAEADRRVLEYEGQLRAARNEVYAEQLRALKAIEHENSIELEKSRHAAERHVFALTAELRTQAEQSRHALEEQTGDLADRIVARVLEGHAA